MTFKNYLVSKKTILIIFFSFQFLALFVNVFGIQGEFKTKSPCDEKREVTNYIFTRKDYRDNEKEYQSNFWPFVNFFYPSEEMLDKCYDPFFGLFRYYDFSEFLAYTALLFLIFYIEWTSSNSKAKPINNNTKPK